MVALVVTSAACPSYNTSVISVAHVSIRQSFGWQVEGACQRAGAGWEVPRDDLPIDLPILSRRRGTRKIGWDTSPARIFA